MYKSNGYRLLTLVFLLLVSMTASATVEYRFDRKIPQLEQPWYFVGTTSLAFAHDGDLYVVNQGLVIVLNSEGRYIRSFGGPDAMKIAVNKQTNEVYVYATNNVDGEIRVFDFAGELLRKWPIGSRFLGVSDIALDSQNHVFLSCNGWDGHDIDEQGQPANTPKIMVFDSNNGTKINEWGGLGSEHSQFSRSLALSVVVNKHSGLEELWVADGSNSEIPEIPLAKAVDNNRVQIFDTSGNYLRSFGRYGSHPGEFLYIGDIVADSSGMVYVLDKQSSRIQVFEPGYGDGSVQSESVIPSQEISYGSEVLAIDSDDTLVVSPYDAPFLQFIKTDGSLIRQWGSNSHLDGYLYVPQDVVVNAAGDIFVADMANHRIQVFDKIGQFKYAWGRTLNPPYYDSDGKGYFYRPFSVALNQEQTELYVLEGGGHLQVFNVKNCIPTVSNNNCFLRQWGKQDGSPYNFGGWGGHIVVAKDGTLYVSDAGSTAAHNRILVFNPQGDLLRTWSGEGNGDKNVDNGEFGASASLALSNDDQELYVGSEVTMQVFDALTGKFKRKWEGDTDFAKKFVLGGNGISGITLDKQLNELYLGNYWGHNVSIFDLNGNYLRSFGEAGILEGQFPGFYAPGQVALDHQGRVYVVDTNANRIQIFNKIDSPNNSKAIIVAAGTPAASNPLWTATELNANFAFRTLTSQGFKKNEIRYLSGNTLQDIDNNGQFDDFGDNTRNDHNHTGLPTKANLQNVLTEWAKGTNDAPTDNLILYLIDHGGDNTFRLNATETLTVTELDQWLTSLETARPNLQQITIIIDACQSGSMIRTLSKGKRRILTSAGALENAYFLDQGVISFSNYFWTNLFHGSDLKSAFESATMAMKAYQTPQVDFNGNGIPNETGDFSQLDSHYLGNGVGSSNSSPVVSTIQAAPATFHSFGNSVANFSRLSANITDGDGVLNAYFVVRTPDFDPGSANNTITRLPKIPLTYDNALGLYISNGYWDTDSQGQYAFYKGDYSFNKPGTYVLTLYAQDTSYNTAAPQQITVTVDSGKKRRAAIIDGYSPNADLSSIFHANAKLAHDALIRQGYKEDDIYYLSSLGQTGVDAAPSSNNLQFALTQWGMTNTVDNTEDLTVYMIGDRGIINNEAGFLLSSQEGVTFTQLNGWLNTRQTRMNTSTGLPYSGLVTVIMDACYSGEMLGALKPTGSFRRVLISSTTGDGTAHFTNHKLANGQSFSSELSFSRVFWQKVQLGSNLRDAFSAAGNAVNLIAGVQTPQLDDNGNGFGNDAGSINPDLAKDGDLARKYSLGYGIFTAEDQPKIVDHTPSADNDSGQVNLDMQVATTSTIADAWVVIKRPDYSPDCGPYDQLPKIHLTADPDHPEHWKSTYSKLNINGDYQLTFYAVDNNAQQSDPATATITRKSAVAQNYAGASAGLFEPDNALSQAHMIRVHGQVAQTYALETADDQDYIIFYGRKGKPYTVSLNQVGADIDPGFEIVDAQNQPQRTLVDTNGKGEGETIYFNAQSDGFYYIRVINSGHTVGLQNSYQVRVDLRNAPQIGIVEGKITDACNGKPLSFIRIEANNDYAVSYQGDYSLELTPDTYLLITGDGVDYYATQSKTQTVNELDNLTIDFSLTPRSGCPILSCPIGQHLLNEQCVAITCPVGQQLRDDHCIPIRCPSGQELQGSQCVAIDCPSGQQLQGDQCLPINCPSGQELQGSQCTAINCPSGQRLQVNQCLPINCPTGQELQGSQCVAINCPSGQQLQGNQCLTINCPSGQQLQGNQCLPINCPTGQEFRDNRCIALSCPTGLLLLENQCAPLPSPSCSSNQILQNGVCITPMGAETSNKRTIMGNFEGDATHPPTLIDSSIGKDAQISHVIIGQGTYVDPNAKLGEGVKFTDNRLIPVNGDLSHALKKSGDNQAIDLSYDVLVNGISLLAQIQNLVGFEKLPIQQKSDGKLRINVGEREYTVVPINVRQAPAGTPPGVQYLDDGTVQLVTASGRALILIASLSEISDFKQALAMLGLTLAQQDGQNGNLRVNLGAVPKQAQIQQTLLYYLVRPDVFSEPAKLDQQQESINLMPSKVLKNFEIAYQIFNQNGELRQQALFPIPLDWPSIQTTLLQRGFSQIKLNPNGIFQADKDGMRYQAISGYGIYQGDETGALRFESAGDLNQDGIEDFWFIYPDGRRQSHWLFPAQKLP